VAVSLLCGLAVRVKMRVSQGIAFDESVSPKLPRPGGWGYWSEGSIP